MTDQRESSIEQDLNRVGEDSLNGDSFQPDSHETMHARPGGKARIFISYKRNADPDEKVALRIFEELNQQHDVFIDQSMPVGERWPERLEAELQRSDFFIPFLSAESVSSEMVLAEIETANRLAKERIGSPVILPVRVAYRRPFLYPLSAYLNQINWTYWDSPDDTERLVKELHLAISGRDLRIDSAQTKEEFIRVDDPPAVPQPVPAAQPSSLELPEGTMDPESMFYESRTSDQMALDVIKKQGVTITVKGPRQMGKSSLLIRIMAAAADVGKRPVLLDFQLIDKASMMNADMFFRQFCYWLTDSLELEDRVEEYFSSPLGNIQRCTRFVAGHVLRSVGRLVLAMDEVDSIFESDFRSDFFAMLRAWHNDRAYKPIWKQLDLALVTSTEPYQLIENLNQSPFNVGLVVELVDFSRQEVSDLNRRHGSPLRPEEERELMSLVGGHPYLIRRALYMLTMRQITLPALMSRAIDDRGPFGDHLRYHLFRLHGKAELVKALRQVINHNSCTDNRLFFRLRGAGLVRSEGTAVVPRCKLYADYFKEHLHD